MTAPPEDHELNLGIPLRRPTRQDYDAFDTKPVDLKRLLGKIGRWLHAPEPS